jgi:hypothetical protein
VSGTGYLQALKVRCNFTGVPVNTYDVRVTVDGGYYTGVGERFLGVYDPNATTVYGGGWFNWPGTSDITFFGFLASKQGANPMGALLLFRVGADESYHRVSGNSLTGMSTGTTQSGSSTYGWTSFSGKATYKSGQSSTPAGNYSFEVYAEDRNQPGTGTDRFWIELKDPSGNVVSAISRPRPSSSNTVPLLGGNIKVPH